MEYTLSVFAKQLYFFLLVKIKLGYIDKSFYRFSLSIKKYFIIFKYKNH